MPQGHITFDLELDQMQALLNAAAYYDMTDEELLRICMKKGIAMVLAEMAEELRPGKEAARNMSDSDIPF